MKHDLPERLNIAMMSSSQVVDLLVGMTVDVTVESLCYNLARYYRTGSCDYRIRDMIACVEQAWYRSVDRGQPDYSVYSSNYYLAESFACFAVYSKGYVRNLTKSVQGKQPVADMVAAGSTIVDLGCGCGLTTALLKSVFPSADVYGTQLKGLQHAIATAIGRQAGFTVLESIGNLLPDVVFASEYIEHFKEPIAHIAPIMDTRPALTVFANSFSASALGHFSEYKVGGELIQNKKMGRYFNRWMRSLDYAQVDTGFYNQRLCVWKDSNNEA